MALLLALLFATAVLAQEEATVARLETTSSRDDSGVTPAGSAAQSTYSSTAPQTLFETTTGKTDEKAPKGEDMLPASSHTVTASNVNSISIIDTSSNPTKHIDLVSSNTTPEKLETATNSVSPFSDTSTVKPTTDPEIGNDIVPREELTTAGAERLPTTTSRWTTGGEVLTTSKPVETRSTTVVATVQTSTARTVPATEQYSNKLVRDTGISSTVKPVVSPDAYAGNSGLDIESMEDSAKVPLASTFRPVSSTVRYVTRPLTTRIATNRPVTRIDIVSNATPRPVAVPAASNNVPVSVPPPGQHNKVPGTRRKGGIKIKRHRKKDNGFSSLLYIPIMIQAQMIPMMLMKLKFLALKALTIGKLALLILGLNLLRNAMLGYSSDEQQYEHETLASQHYGYKGGPEYGSWINRRMYTPPGNNEADQRHDSQYKPSTSTNSRRTLSNSRGEKLSNLQSTSYFPENNENYPYRAYRNQDNKAIS